ncbi:MAG: LTA synthase family protein [Phycisphaerae bacterium]
MTKGESPSDPVQPGGSATPAWARRAALAVRRAFCGQRAKAFWITAVAMWLVFAAFRVGLMIACRADIAAAGAANLIRCLWVGMVYDAMPIGYALAPLAVALVLAPASAFARAGFRRMIATYCTAAVVLMLCVETIGAGFFLEFGCRLNWRAMDYFGHFGEVWQYIWREYHLLLVTAGMIIAACLTYLLLRRVIWSGPGAAEPWWLRLPRAAVAGVLCFLAMRGGWDKIPLQSGRAYFCENQVVSELTLNNVFTLARAVESSLGERSEESDFQFPDLADASRTVQQMIIQPADELVWGDANPLMRVTRTGRPMLRPNVVVIVMEGMAGRPVGAMGYAPSSTPFFDSLCSRGLFFDQMYAVGDRTSRGMVGALCGFPDLRYQSVMEKSRAKGRFTTLPSIFRDRGYRTMFLYGGNADFDNMKAFFAADGVERVIDIDGMPAGDLRTTWGAHDEVTLDRAHQAFEGMGDRTFFAQVLTLSNHEPFRMPEGRCPGLLPADNERNMVLNGYRYADWALEEFFRKARGSAYFARTVFVLVSDHGRRDRHKRLDLAGHRVPCVIYAPGIVPARRVSTVCSQADIAPTLLSLLGGNYTHCFFGRDLLAVRPDDGFAVNLIEDRLTLVERDITISMIPARPPWAFRLQNDETVSVRLDQVGQERLDRMRHQLLSHVKLASHVYLNGLQQVPAGDGH